MGTLRAPPAMAHRVLDEDLLEDAAILQRHGQSVGDRAPFRVQVVGRENRVLLAEDRKSVV